MTDASLPCPALGGPRTGTHGGWTTGLRALATLVNEALATRVTPGPARFPGLALAAPVSEAPDVSPDVSTRPRPRPAPHGRPAPSAVRAAATGIDTDTAVDIDTDTDIDEAVDPTGPVDGGPDAGSDGDPGHAEVWHLVRRAQAGDGEAFGQLYDRYVDTVFRFIYYRVNDRALAEDFTSETFLRALRRIGSISYQGRDIGAWFVTIARNIVLDHVKSARNRLEVTTAEHPESREHHASTETAVLESLQSEQLIAAVNRLGDEQRECIMLRFIQGLSVAETAAVMGKNDGAIKALQHRAVRKLAELVGGDLR